MPCEILMSEKQQQPETRIVVNDTSQLSVECDLVVVGRSTVNLLHKFTAESALKKIEIGQRLVKLRVNCFKRPMRLGHCPAGR